MFSATQQFISPESFGLFESIIVLAMVVLGGMGNIPGVILGAVLLTLLPEVLRYTMEPLQMALFGRVLIDAETIRMLVFGVALVADHAFPAGRTVAVGGAQARAREGCGQERAKRPMSERTLLSAERYRQALRRRAGAGRCELQHPPRRDLRPDRSERRGQDLAVQRADRHLRAGRRQLHVRRCAARSAASRNEVAERGIARTFQNIRLFQNLSALENVMIGRHVRTRAGVFGAIFRDRAHAAPRKRRSPAARYQLLDYVGVAARANDLAKHLAYGDQRRLEIARALATDPKLLALDEPAAGMNATETQALKGLLEDIRRDGTTILLIEHDMKLVMSVCDRVLVLDYGTQDRRGERRGRAERPEGDRRISGRRGHAARQGCR